MHIACARRTERRRARRSRRRRAQARPRAAEAALACNPAPRAAARIVQGTAERGESATRNGAALTAPNRPPQVMTFDGWVDHLMREMLEVNFDDWFRVRPST